LRNLFASEPAARCLIAQFIGVGFRGCGSRISGFACRRSASASREKLPRVRLALPAQRTGRDEHTAVAYFLDECQLPGKRPGGELFARLAFPGQDRSEAPSS